MAVNTRLEQFINGVAVQVYNEQSCLLMEQRMRKAYQAAITDIQKKLDDFYEKYAKDNKISLQEAKLKLNAKDTQNVQNIAEEYRKLLNRKRIGRGTQQKLKEIVSKAKATRYDELLVNCVEQLAKVGIEANDEMDDTASLMYKDAFGHTMFNTQKTLGMGVNFNLPSERLIRVASNTEWLGSTFKERTGYTLDAVTNNIETIMTEAFIQGKNPDKLGKLLARQFNMSENACKRDMRTLTTMITNQASVMAYKNCELVEEYEFVATLDGKTSDKCRAMDGKRFKIIEAVAFVNLPPLHYNCRSTTIPYFDDLDEFSASDRIARDESGKSYFVGEDVTYKDWVTSHARGLYARNDKTDWNYTPEKVIANEVIIEERQKLKKLQDERVVYDAAELTSGNIDLSVYSDKQLDKIKTYLKSIGMIGDLVSSFKDNNVFKDAVIKFSDKILALRKKLQESDLNGNNGLNFTNADFDFLFNSVNDGVSFLLSTTAPQILNSNSKYQRFVTAMGLNEKPTAVSRDEFDKMLKDSEYPEMFRSVKNAGDTDEAFDVKGNREQRGKYIRRAIMNDLLYGEKQFIGHGVYGDGLYFSTKPTYGIYGEFIGTEEEAIERKVMVRAAIKPGTKVIAYDDIPKLAEKLGLSGFDEAAVARIAGYKVIKAGRAKGLGGRDLFDEEYYNVIDRSCLVIEDVDKKSHDKAKDKSTKRLSEEDIQQIERKDSIDWDEAKKQAEKIFKYYKQTNDVVKEQEKQQLEKEVVSENNQKYYKQVMYDIFERNDFAMSIDGNILDIIADSWFMNQLESERVLLGLTRNRRMNFSKKMFGIQKNADFGDFEKYGYLASKNPKDDFKYNEQFTGGYGNTVVRFKKKNLLSRTTFTIGDSLYNFEQGWVTASPVVAPSIASIKQGDVNKSIYGLSVCENADQLKNTISIQGALQQKYIELQYHGKITIDDVESVTINADSENNNSKVDINSEHMQKIIKMLKEKGIKVYYVDSKTEEIRQL